MTEPREKSNAAKFIEINDFIRKNELIECHDDKTVSYKGDWCDQRVADAVNASPSSVKTVRKQIYGVLRREGKANEIAMLKEELHHLTRHVDRIGAAYDRLCVKLNMPGLQVPKSNGE